MHLGQKVSLSWFSEPVQPVPGHLLTSLKHAYAYWSVEFDIIALGPQGSQHSSIFHVTTGENAAGMGTRYPSIFITQSYQKLQFQNDLSGMANKGYVHPEPLSESLWTSVKVEGYLFSTDVMSKNTNFNPKNKSGWCSVPSGAWFLPSRVDP